MSFNSRIDRLEALVLQLTQRLDSLEPLTAEDMRAAMNRRKLPAIPAEFADGMEVDQKTMAEPWPQPKVWYPPSLEKSS